jgi:hypothetical protein
MSKTKELIKYGNVLFLIGLLITVIGGLLNLAPANSKIVITTLFIIGIAIGILNITSKEAVPFMISGMAVVMLTQPMLVAMSQRFGLQGVVLEILGGIFTYLVALLVPAVLVVAFRTFFQTAKD